MPTNVVSPLHIWAERYHAQGFTLVAQKGKQPLQKYLGWKENRQTLDQVRRLNWRRADGLAALLTGHDNFVALDFDTCTDENFVTKLLAELGLPAEYGWTVRTGSGFHVWLRVDDKEFFGETKKYDRDTHTEACAHLELRIQGVLTTLPPSRHPSGKIYTLLHPDQAASGPAEVSAAKLFEVYERHTVAPTPQVYDLPEAELVPRDAGNVHPYAEAALHNALAEVASAAQGHRNHLLYNKAFAIARLVLAGGLDEARVRVEFERAALSCGLTADEARRTITSAFAKGLSMPRGIPKKKRKRKKKANRRAAAPALPEAHSVMARRQAAARARAVAPLYEASHIYVKHAYIPADTLTEALQDRATIALKSALGTGKTTAVKAATDHVPHLWAITHSENLARQLATKFEADCYKDIPGDMYADAARLVVTPNSLHKVSQTPALDVLFLDEFGQLLSAIVGDEKGRGTMRGPEKLTALNELSHLIKQARVVIVSDAYLSDVALNFLYAVREAPLTIIENTFIPQRKACTISSSPSTQFHQLQNEVRTAEAPVLAAYGSQKECEAHAALLADEHGSDAVKVITGGNKDAQFIAHINAELPKYKALLYTSAIPSGVDITTNVAAVYGFFGPDPLQHTDMLQMLARARQAPRIYVTLPVEARETPLETDPEQIYAHSLQNALENRRLEMAFIRNEAGMRDFSPENAHLARLHATIQADRAISRNDLLAHFLNDAEANGWHCTIHWAGKDDAAAISIKEKKAQLKEKRTATLLEVAPIDADTFKTLKDPTPEEMLGFERWKIERRYGQRINRTLIEFEEREGPGKFYFFRNQVVSPLYVVNSDYQQTLDDVPIYERRNASLKTSEFSIIMSLLFGDTDNWAERGRLKLTEAQIQARVGLYIQESYDELARIYGWRHDASRDPIPILRRLLNEAGLGLVTLGEGKNTYYKLDGEKLLFMTELVSTALLNRAENAEERANLEARLATTLGHYELCEADCTIIQKKRQKRSRKDI